MVLECRRRVADEVRDVLPVVEMSAQRVKHHGVRRLIPRGELRFEAGIGSGHHPLKPLVRFPQLRNSIGDDLINEYIAKVRAELGVTINQQALAQATGSGSGSEL